MAWQMKLLKFIKINLGILLMVATSTHGYAYYHQCDFKYNIENAFTICSEKALFDTDTRMILNTYNKTKILYNKHISKYKYRLTNINVKLTIYLMPLASLNNTKYFSKPSNQILYGKYVDWDGNLYTHYDAAFVTKNTDLVHELIHYFNNNVNMQNDQLNENIAQELEQHYNDEI